MSGTGNSEDFGVGVFGEDGGHLHLDNIFIDTFAFGKSDDFGAGSEIGILV